MEPFKTKKLKPTKENGPPYLAVEELEEVERDGVEAVVDGPHDGLDGALDVVDAGALLGVRVGRGRQHQRLRRRLLHELEVPQPLLLLLLLGRRPLNRHLLLRIKNTPKISTTRNRTKRSRIRGVGTL